MPDAGTSVDAADRQTLPSFAPTSADDDLAAREAMSFGQGLDIERDGAEREHVRHQAFRDQINFAMVSLFWLVAVCVAVGILAYAWHMVMPASLHWLDPEAQSELKSLLGTAVLSSALTGYVKKRMD